MLGISPLITAYLVVLAGVLGLVFGSFSNCLAYRLVRHESIMGRSHCPCCGHPLKARDLVPLLSFLLLKGKCRYCGSKIGARYPLSEAACAVIWVLTLLRFDVTFDFLKYIVLLTVCFCLTVTDIDDMLIPDSLLVFAAAAFVPLTLLADGAKGLLDGIIGAAALFVPLLAIVLIMEKVIKTDAMGGGDLKLIAVLGLYFGWARGLLLVIFSCIIGLIFFAASGKLRSKAALPFGPALSAAAFLTALFGQAVIDFYISLF